VPTSETKSRSKKRTIGVKSGRLHDSPNALGLELSKFADIVATLEAAKKHRRVYVSVNLAAGLPVMYLDEKNKQNGSDSQTVLITEQSARALRKLLKDFTEAWKDWSKHRYHIYECGCKIRKHNFAHCPEHGAPYVETRYIPSKEPQSRIPPGQYFAEVDHDGNYLTVIKGEFKGRKVKL
jgi:hypothetical protein